MAVIYLKHPIHGAKVAISDMEADNDMANGWEPFGPNAPVEEVVPAAPVNELQPRRRGRPARGVSQTNGE